MPLSKAYQGFVIRLLFQVLLARIFPPVNKSSKPEHSGICQLIQEFRSKEGKKITAIYLMMLKHSTLRYQKCRTFSMTKSLCLDSLLQAIHVRMKNKQNHSRVNWIFFRILLPWRGEKDAILFLFVAI